MKRTSWFLVIAAVLLMALAVRVGIRLWREQAAPISAADGPGLYLSGPGGTRRIEILPAPELPPTEPDQRGLFLRRQDNTLTIGTGQFRINLADDKVSTSHDGPELEVVISRATQLYRDVTRFDEIGPQDTEVQQKLVSGLVEEIEENALITAWGEKRGDRFFATTLVFKLVGE